MNSFADLVKGKKVLVFGLGLQGGGVGDALWLHAHGATVRVTDLKSASELSKSLQKLPSEITRTLSEHKTEDIEWAEIIIKNPGVSVDNPQLLLAKKLQKKIVTSIAIVVQEAREKTIGVTGTRGKSTTTELIYSVLNSLYPGKVLKGGNLAGTSALLLLDQLDSAKYIVLELSSFQLSGLHDLQISPRYSVVTNIYPDHLNRYPNMNAYKLDKSAIFAYQKPEDYLFVNANNQDSLAMTTSVVSHRELFDTKNVPADWNVFLPGIHNRENIAAVISLLTVIGIDLSIVENIIKSFHSLPFRLELIGESENVKYYNDTTSTTPTSTIKAVQSLPNPLILILGGDDKKLPTNTLIKVLSTSQSLRKIILLGCKNIPDFVKALKEACPNMIYAQVFTMSEAVRKAKSLAKPGDVILLSPGFASFDLFENEFDRGRQFNEEVSKLTK